jgi:hypothetical protein
MSYNKVDKPFGNRRQSWDRNIDLGVVSMGVISSALKLDHSEHWHLREAGQWKQVKDIKKKI